MTQRLPSDARLKQLQMALARVARGRAHKARGRSLSIQAVAEEAGVSAALIHNKYPMIAEEIRDRQNRSSRVQRDLKQDALNEALGRNKALREEIATLRSKVALLASQNATLEAENTSLRAALGSDKVAVLTRRPT